MDGSLMVYTLGFEDFLKLQTDPRVALEERKSQLNY